MQEQAQISVFHLPFLPIICSTISRALQDEDEDKETDFVVSRIIHLPYLFFVNLHYLQISLSNRSPMPPQNVAVLTCFGSRSLHLDEFRILLLSPRYLARQFEQKTRARRGMEKLYIWLVRVPNDTRDYSDSEL